MLAHTILDMECANMLKTAFQHVGTHPILYMECANMLQTAFQHVGTHQVVYGVRQHAENSFAACWHTPDAGVVSRGE